MYWTGSEQGGRDGSEYLAQQTWKQHSNRVDAVQRECKWAHKASLSFSFWLGQVLSPALCYQKKIGLVIHH